MHKYQFDYKLVSGLNMVAIWDFGIPATPKYQNLSLQTYNYCFCSYQLKTTVNLKAGCTNNTLNGW